jgi:hypothetical protein
MLYYKTGATKTVKLIWTPKNLLTFYPNQKIGRAFEPRAWEQKNSFITVAGSNGAISPSRGGIIQYRVYGCYPNDYNQLLKGHVLSPNLTWASARQALKIPSGRGGYIGMAAFFIPTVADRQKGLRPTYSLIIGGWDFKPRIILAPSCPLNLQRPDGSCNCPEYVCAGIPPICPSATHPKTCTSRNENFGVMWQFTPCSPDSIAWKQFFEPGKV